MDNHIDIKGQGINGITLGGDTRGRTVINNSTGTPKYVGARAEVKRTPNGVLIRLSDYKGTTEEIIAEAIEDIITNPDGSLLFVLPDGRTILTDSLKGEIGPQGPQGEPGPQGEAGPQGPQGEPGPTDYELMTNKPSLNLFTIEGDKTAADYRLQDKMDLITEQMIDNLFYGRT